MKTRCGIITDEIVIHQIPNDVDESNYNKVIIVHPTISRTHTVYKLNNSNGEKKPSNYVQNKYDMQGPLTTSEFGVGSNKMTLAYTYYTMHNTPPNLRQI